MKTLRFTILLLLCSLQVYSQTDTLISYNVETGSTTIYTPVLYDTSIVFENTSWNYGTEPGFEYLDLTPPSNPYPGAGFTDYTPVQNIYSINNYPIRTAVKIFFITNDSLKHKCSGLMVEKDYVLTDCHCISSYDTNGVLKFQDSLLVMPAFDNGNENILFGKSVAKEYFTFKINLADYWHKDMALIKLENDLGSKTGWMGIAFSKDDSFYEDKVFHKFSYPTEVDYYDSTRVYNGDTLYYNYGILDDISSGWLGYNINGVRGQSGSSLFYTDNEEFFSLGTIVFANHSNHIRITPEIYYSFKSIITYKIADTEYEENQVSDYYLSDAYPNPFNPVTKINYSVPASGIVNIKVFDALGSVVTVLINEGKPAGLYTAEFNGTALSSGVYYFQIKAGNFMQTKKMLLLK